MDFSNLIHKGIMDNDRWIHMPLSQQMGNIGAEVSRLVNRKEKSKDNVDASLDRALELIDLTVYGLQKTKKMAEIRELLRFREVICDYTYNLGMFDISGKQLVDYCTQYVLIFVNP